MNTKTKNSGKEFHLWRDFMETAALIWGEERVLLASGSCAPVPWALTHWEKKRMSYLFLKETSLPPILLLMNHLLETHCSCLTRRASCYVWGTSAGDTAGRHAGHCGEAQFRHGGKDVEQVSSCQSRRACLASSSSPHSLTGTRVSHSGRGKSPAIYPHLLCAHSLGAAHL